MNLRTHISGAHIIPILGIGLSVLVFRPGAAARPAIQERIEDRQETTQRCDSLTSLVYQTFDERAEAGAGAPVCVNNFETTLL